MSRETINGTKGPSGPRALQSNSESYHNMVDTYRRNICVNPKRKQEEHLDRIARTLGEDELLCLDTEFYRTQMTKLREKMYKMYTGYAQCCGDLVIDNGAILMCCCEEMAEAVCFHGAHVHDDKLFICDSNSEEFVAEDDTTYLIKETRPMSTNHCPFCGADVIRLKVDSVPGVSESE